MKSNTRTEKLNAITRYQKITGSIQVIEICLFLMLVATQIPAAFKNSGVYFRDLYMILASPRVVFLIGNAIVIFLFAKSGHFQAQSSTVKGSGTDLYKEFIERSENQQPSRQFEIEYQQKQSKTDVSRILQSTNNSCDAKNYKRSHSVDMNLDRIEKPGCVLRRSVTEKCERFVKSGNGKVEELNKEEKMSNKEFRSKIEAFIARQQRMRRGETECYVS